MHDSHTLTSEVDPFSDIVEKLTSDLRKASTRMERREIEMLVKNYYVVQEHRMAIGSQKLALEKANLPTQATEWLHAQFETLERRVKSMLKAWAKVDPLASWMMSQYGVGPVLSSGLVAMIDWSGSSHVSRIYSFAGLAPGKIWEKGKKRPYNADLKVLCWKLGESFRRFHKNEQCFYGHLYAERKRQEIVKNEQGEFAEQAAANLARLKDKTTITYKRNSEGKLSDGHIDARAARWAVKIFLSHALEVSMLYDGRKPPEPYAIAHLGHVDKIEIPNKPIVGKPKET